MIFFVCIKAPPRAAGAGQKATFVAGQKEIGHTIRNKVKQINFNKHHYLGSYRL